jgi:hypothetical protein
MISLSRNSRGSGFESLAAHNSPRHASALGFLMSAAALYVLRLRLAAGGSHWLSGVDAGEGEELLAGSGMLAEHAVQG